jgi:ParB-like chromosome segregation protein Spo0J
MNASMNASLQHATWPISRLIEYGNNPRINDHAVEKIAAAISEFGFRVPVLVKSDGLVIDGHLRLKAARKLGMTDIPVILADDLTDVQIRAFRLSVNRMAELAEWNYDLLRLELNDLSALEFDTANLGFDADELRDLTGAIFNPNMRPLIAQNQVTATDMEKAKKKLGEDLTSGYEKKVFMQIECPHCATHFDVEKK